MTPAMIRFLGFGQVYFILYHVAHTDGRNHTIQHEAYASDAIEDGMVLMSADTFSE